jgi:hypothetical protein
LAVYSGPYPSPTPDLLVSQQLAWVAVSDHIPVGMRGVSYPHLPGESSPVTRPPCHFGKRFDVFDARTGKHLTSSVTGE